MELNKKTMTIGVILTLLCVAVGVVCLAVRPTTFTWIMFAVILALAIFQVITLWYFAKKVSEGNNADKQDDINKANSQEDKVAKETGVEAEDKVSNNN